MVSAITLTYTSPPSLSLPQVLAIHSEAERERTEAKRKIAKLEDALRYNKKDQTQSGICCSNKFEYEKHFYLALIKELVSKNTVFHGTDNHCILNTPPQHWSSYSLNTNSFTHIYVTVYFTQ